MNEKHKRYDIFTTARNKSELAKSLGLTPSFLTKTLYTVDISKYYYSFEIPKSSGGVRIINAPKDPLKEIQKKLSLILLDCIDVINYDKNISSNLSHGFVREHSIVTNAVIHKNQKNVLNIDLENFFGSINFGRVRGFFLKNKNFKFNEDVATTIAKIACFDNSLPQGSPCSPVIANLILHSLDIRLAYLAYKNNSIYSRYADDITFSTREKVFSKYLVDNKDGLFIVGKKLNKEITKAGFTVNNKKTRVQYRNSRQDVTGLTVNKKINVNAKYYRQVRAMCDHLFKTGSFFIKKKILTDSGFEMKEEEGKISSLCGKLSFIDSIDKYNNRIVQENNRTNCKDKNKVEDLNVREKTYSKFLFYNYFYNNSQPLLLCEGKTDNVYIRLAIKSLSSKFPNLIEQDTHKLKLSFMGYSSKTKFLLGLAGGTSFLKKFIENYNKSYDRYKAPHNNTPVMILLDNDKGANDIVNLLTKKFPNCPDSQTEIRNESFLYITKNLYLILTPLRGDESTCIEDFFEQDVREVQLSGKSFDPNNDINTDTHYGKKIFAESVILPKMKTVSFKKFSPILESIEKVINHYKIMNN